MQRALDERSRGRLSAFISRTDLSFVKKGWITSPRDAPILPRDQRGSAAEQLPPHCSSFSPPGLMDSVGQESGRGLAAL